MCNTTPLLPSLSPVSGKTVEAAFEGGSLTSDADVLVLREVERRLDVGGRLAACIAERHARLSAGAKHGPRVTSSRRATCPLGCRRSAATIRRSSPIREAMIQDLPDTPEGVLQARDGGVVPVREFKPFSAVVFDQWALRLPAALPLLCAFWSSGSVRYIWGEDKALRVIHEASKRL